MLSFPLNHRQQYRLGSKAKEKPPSKLKVTTLSHENINDTQLKLKTSVL